MRTKYILHLADGDYTLADDDIRNWDEIACTYKRDSYGGVVRSFTSKFEFVNNACDRLLSLYLRERFNAVAVLEVLTLDEYWRFNSRFVCPLDFSTIEWEGGVLAINAVDNTLAAKIKAAKSTKYELEVGADVRVSRQLYFDRIPMLESLVYGFTQGTSSEDDTRIYVTFNRDELPWVGNKGEEILVNNVIAWKEDQETTPGSYLLKAMRDTKVKFRYNMTWREDSVTNNIWFRVRVRRGNEILPCGEGTGIEFAEVAKSQMYLMGVFKAGQPLPDLSNPIWLDTNHTIDQRSRAYCVVDGIVWDTSYNGHAYTWKTRSQSVDEYFARQKDGEYTLNLKDGDFVFIEHEIQNWSEFNQSFVLFLDSEFGFEWLATADPVMINVCTPKDVANALLKKIAGPGLNVMAEISAHDPRIANTYLMAAESIRDISGAKLYTSFNEFCDWMSAVFGYVYELGDVISDTYPYKRTFGHIVARMGEVPSDEFRGQIDESQILYDTARTRFFYLDNGRNFDKWPGCENYNAETRLPRTDTVFVDDNGNAYVFNVHPEKGPVTFDLDMFGKDMQTVRFLHRSEILRPDAHVGEIINVKEVKYTVDASAIYSTITAGYDKKDYETANGRDEFNFSNTYTTGCSVSDRTLNLTSKYRADCYGIEFACQKRSQNTTDTASDKDVFFALCTMQDYRLVVDRTASIENSITGRVFNGAFSPMACIRANAGFIGLQADRIELMFASSTGNSNIVIDGESMTDGITLNTPIATCGAVEFSTDTTELPGGVNDIVEITDNGKIYRGYISNVDVRYAKAQTAIYKLIAKEIVPC